jgi:hypothetical protein
MGTEPKLYEHERLYKARRDAADELYEALEVARGEIAKIHQLRSALPQIDAALAKARGEYNGH